jgi:GNAT superfamily N-acetyltransferase
VRQLAQHSIIGFAEMLACLGRTGVGGATELRSGGLVGARVPWAADNHWIDAAVADAGAELVDPPHCVWSTVVPESRRELSEIAMPCMGLDLGDWPAPDEAPIETPPLSLVGELNDRAYGQRDRLGPLVASIVDPRVRTHGVRVDGEWACVALTLRVGDDVSVQYVATEARYRRQGLAARVVAASLADARADGMRTATLQASPDGRSVYERLGFRSVATLRASASPPGAGDDPIET